MKKLCLLALCLLLLCCPAFAEGTQSRTISSLTAEYTVASDGSCRVELTLAADARLGTVDFPIPADARNVSCYPGASVQRLEQGTALRLSGAEEYHIAYELPETAVAVAAGQRMELKLLLPALDCAVAQYSATIRLPQRFEELPVLKSGYHGENIDNYMTIGIDEGVISMQTTQPLRDHESLSLTLSLPTGYFDLRFLAGKTGMIDTVAFWLLLAAALVFWFLFLRNRLFVPRAQAMPPLSASAGVMPYLLTGDTPDLAYQVMHWGSLGYLTIARTRTGKLYLKKQIDMGSERKEYEQRIFRSLFDRSDLCNAHGEAYSNARRTMPVVAKGYWQRQLFAPKGGKPIVLRLLGVGSALALSLRTFDVLVAAQSWRWLLIVPLTLLGGLAAWLIQPTVGCLLRRKPARTLLLALLGLLYLAICANRAGLGAMLFVCVLAQLLIGLGLLLGGRRKKQGQRLAEECFGLRRYLQTIRPETLRELLEDDPQFYYKMLPYADALRVGGQFSKKFGRLEGCTWLTAEGVRPKNAAGFWQLYCLVMDELREQTDAPLRNLLQNLRRRKRRQSGALR